MNFSDIQQEGMYAMDAVALKRGIAYIYGSAVHGDVIEFGCYLGRTAAALAHGMSLCQEADNRPPEYGEQRAWDEAKKPARFGLPIGGRMVSLGVVSSCMVIRECRPLGVNMGHRRLALDQSQCGHPIARAWTMRDSLLHQFFDCLVLIGLRDRLRCPCCKAVGTWKPHGGWCDRLTDCLPTEKARAFFALLAKTGARYATERRYVCKYCGFTHDVNGTHMGAPNGKTKVWDNICSDSLPTPKHAVEKLCGTTWPWRG